MFFAAPQYSKTAQLQANSCTDLARIEQSRDQGVVRPLIQNLHSCAVMQLVGRAIFSIANALGICIAIALNENPSYPAKHFASPWAHPKPVTSCQT
jgi:hypothetical protein